MRSSRSQQGLTSTVLVVGIFAVGVVVLLLRAGSGAPKLEQRPGEPIDPSVWQSPRRTPIGDPPMAHIGGVDQRCSDCHELFESADKTFAEITQHQNLVSQHGRLEHCSRCHALNDKNRLVLQDGSKIGFADARLLCAQCHGPTFRDWEEGTHGKVIGSWKRDSELRRKLDCIECHDPHAPAYPPLPALRGPLQGGDGHGGERAPSRNPLDPTRNRGANRP